MVLPIQYLILFFGGKCMRKVSFLVLVIVFVFVFTGCSNVGKQMINSVKSRIEVQEQLEKINKLLDDEEFDKAFELTKSIVNSPFAGVDEMNAIVVKFQDKNRIEEGLYILNVLLLRNKNNDNTLNNLSWAYHMLYKNESANYFADRALDILPNSEYEYVNKANALRGLGKLDEAIKYYDMALKINSNFSEAIWGKAMTYNDMQNYIKSLEFFKKYREIKPEDEESTRYYIASCYREMNQPINAIKEYENHFKKDETDTSPLYSIAYIYYEQKEYNKALEYYNKILGIEPDDAWAYFNQVDCLAKMDRIDEAIKALKKAIELDPECFYEIYYLDEIDKIKKHKEFVTIFQ